MITCILMKAVFTCVTVLIACAVSSIVELENDFSSSENVKLWRLKVVWGSCIGIVVSIILLILTF